MGWSFSDYNILVKCDDEYVLFNTRTLAMAEIDKEWYTYFNNKDCSFFKRINENEINMLLENGYLIDDKMNELDLLRSDYWENKFSCPTLHISIMTTLDCNFKCFYCFEKKRKLYMDADTEGEIYEFIKGNIRNYKNLQIDWYGGEPLLNITSIKRLSVKLIELCKGESVNYNASITTNGYNINCFTKEELQKYQITSMQVTLDGIRDIHDSRRMLINGDGTYEQIIENIKCYKDIQFDIRVNIDNESYGAARALFDELKRLKLVNINISVKGIVSSDFNPCYEKEIEDAKLPLITLKLYDYLETLGIPSAFSNCFEQLTREYCVVDTDSQYIISPDGGVFKCGEAFDETDPGRIGKLEEGEITRCEAFYSWIKDPFEFQECVKCRVLPLCMGGCQLIRNVKKLSPCHSEYKYGIEHLIINQYRKRKKVYR